MKPQNLIVASVTFAALLSAALPARADDFAGFDRVHIAERGERGDRGERGERQEMRRDDAQERQLEREREHEPAGYGTGYERRHQQTREGDDRRRDR